MLLAPVFAYLLVTIAIGLWAARRVRDTADVAIAGRHLPMGMTVTTAFAAWFGSETVLQHVPLSMRVVFFGALPSVPKSPAAAALRAPSVTFVENIRRRFGPRMGDREELRDRRIAALAVAVCACACAIAIALQGTPIHAMVSAACQVTLVGALVPLAAGLHRRRATPQGAVFSIVPGMPIGSLGPQALRNRHGRHALGH
jgi:Na+/proline symporter